MSIQPRKERKTLYNNPGHRRHKRLSAPLAEQLMLKYETRSMPLVKGDTVKVARGDFRGHVGKVIGVNHTTMKVTVDGVTVAKADGTQKPKPVEPSNLLITKLLLTDKLRREKLGASEADVEPEPAAEKTEEKAEAPKKAGSKRADVEDDETPDDTGGEDKEEEK
ncbi:MAG: 50S ribosomal protein L24 [Euryarchaeota archaeon]|nr:50S ribosomal protein L24 [Euryarchaeota archaeon]